VTRSPAPPPVEVSVDGDEARAVLRGEFDMHATFTVEPALERLLEEPGVARITVDLSGLSFIDSTGIGVLLRLQREAGDRGIALALVPGPEPVHHVFVTTGLADALPFAA
jgi:anti-anti-sigma factor